VPPHSLLFTGAEGKLAGGQDKVSQHGEGNYGTPDLSHICGFKEPGDRVHYPSPTQVNVDAGYQDHVRPHESYKPNPGKHLEKIQIGLRSIGRRSSNSLIYGHLD
jgi:hypothetical protein